MENQPEPEALFTDIKEAFRKYGDKLEVPVALAVGYVRFDPKLDKNIRDTQKRADEQMYQDKMRIKEKEEPMESV